MIKHKLNEPFLWNFLKEVPKEIDQSGGEERPITLTMAEENSLEMIKTD